MNLGILIITIVLPTGCFQIYGPGRPDAQIAGPATREYERSVVDKEEPVAPDTGIVTRGPVTDRLNETRSNLTLTVSTNRTGPLQTQQQELASDLENRVAECAEDTTAIQGGSGRKLLQQDGLGESSPADGDTRPGLEVTRVPGLGTTAAVSCDELTQLEAQSVEKVLNVDLEGKTFTTDVGFSIDNPVPGLADIGVTGQAASIIITVSLPGPSGCTEYEVRERIIYKGNQLISVTVDIIVCGSIVFTTVQGLPALCMSETRVDKLDFRQVNDRFEEAALEGINWLLDNVIRENSELCLLAQPTPRTSVFRLYLTVRLPHTVDIIAS